MRLQDPKPQLDSPTLTHSLYSIFYYTEHAVTSDSPIVPVSMWACVHVNCIVYTDLAWVAADAPVVHVSHRQVPAHVALVRRLGEVVKWKNYIWKYVLINNFFLFFF